MSTGNECDHHRLASESLWPDLTAGERARVEAAFASDPEIRRDAERLLGQLPHVELRRVFAAAFAFALTSPTIRETPAGALMPALNATVRTAHEQGQRQR